MNGAVWGRESLHGPFLGSATVPNLLRRCIYEQQRVTRYFEIGDVVSEVVVLGKTYWL